MIKDISLMMGYKHSHMAFRHMALMINHIYRGLITGISMKEIEQQTFQGQQIGFLYLFDLLMVDRNQIIQVP